MQTNVDNLLSFGLFKHTETPNGSGSPALPKKHFATICTAIDDRPITAATVPIFWTIPDIKNEVSDVKDVERFIGSEFAVDIGSYPMHEYSPLLHSFLTP